MGSWRRTRVLYEGLHCDAKGIYPTYIVFTVLVAVTFIVQTVWIVPSSLDLLLQQRFKLSGYRISNLTSL
jgi:hypothetical protein